MGLGSGVMVVLVLSPLKNGKSNISFILLYSMQNDLWGPMNKSTLITKLLLPSYILCLDVEYHLHCYRTRNSVEALCTIYTNDLCAIGRPPCYRNVLSTCNDPGYDAGWLRIIMPESGSYVP